MQVLLLGAGGFIGRHVLSELLAHDFDVVATVRRVDGIVQAFPTVRFVAMDLAQAVDSASWDKMLSGVDVIVNVAGILQGDAMQAIHVDMPQALHAAALRAGVKRTILISAISARADVPTEYARSKLQGEEVVRQSGLDWTILRPSLVYGEGSYGGTSLMRGMAALPWFIPVPGDGDFPFTPIHVRDLAHSVRRVCQNDRFAKMTLEPVGPETIGLRQLLQQYRNWLGFGPARIVHMPMPVMRFFGRVGDLTGQGPISTTSLNQMVAGNAGDGGAFASAIGFPPRPLNDAFRATPAQVQDRWHARLFFLSSAVRATLVLLWLASAALGLFVGHAETARFVSAAGLPDALANPLRIGSALLDIVIAGLVLMDGRARLSTLAQLVVILGYSIILGTILPDLWLDPLGPLLKNLPVLMLVLVHGAISDKR